jgi:hypothetical protein
VHRREAEGEEHEPGEEVLVAKHRPIMGP